MRQNIYLALLRFKLNTYNIIHNTYIRTHACINLVLKLYCRNLGNHKNCLILSFHKNALNRCYSWLIQQQHRQCLKRRVKKIMLMMADIRKQNILDILLTRVNNFYSEIVLNHVISQPFFVYISSFKHLIG